VGTALRCSCGKSGDCERAFAHPTKKFFLLLFISSLSLLPTPAHGALLALAKAAAQAGAGPRTAIDRNPAAALFQVWQFNAFALANPLVRFYNFAQIVENIVQLGTQLPVIVLTCSLTETGNLQMQIVKAVALEHNAREPSSRELNHGITASVQE
jgi:hypothetical protein